jgi:hypothetical protein
MTHRMRRQGPSLIATLNERSMNAYQYLPDLRLRKTLAGHGQAEMNVKKEFCVRRCVGCNKTSQNHQFCSSLLLRVLSSPRLFERVPRLYQVMDGHILGCTELKPLAENFTPISRHWCWPTSSHQSGQDGSDPFSWSRISTSQRWP